MNKIITFRNYIEIIKSIAHFIFFNWKINNIKQLIFSFDSLQRHISYFYFHRNTFFIIAKVINFFHSSFCVFHICTCPMFDEFSRENVFMISFIFFHTGVCKCIMLHHLQLLHHRNRSILGNSMNDFKSTTDKQNIYKPPFLHIAADEMFLSNIDFNL